MATYCNEGQSALVTFPDGGITAFSDTPITIECTPIVGDECQRIYFVATLDVQIAFGGRQTITRTSVPFWGPYNGWRFRRGGNENVAVQVLTRGIGANCSPNFIWADAFSNLNWIRIYNVLSLQVFAIDDNPPLEERRRIIIRGNSGAQLFSGTFNSCNYSVECLGCPPGTLNCGDCCLPCDSTFNALSSIRAMIQKIVRNVPV